MAGPGTRSVLYRLIEAGQVARRVLLAPLQERGLEAGDDALLFLLHEHRGVADTDIAAAVGLEVQALRERLDRLVRRDLIAVQDAGMELTDRGERVRAHLAAYWDEVEDALCGDLTPKQRRTLRRALGRFVTRVRA
jgi:DNA-binding MarR family transcriptional regulator